MGVKRLCRRRAEGSIIVWIELVQNAIPINVVINFINHRNEADQRVYQFLSQKFRLFEGVFGVSNEVLGAVALDVDTGRAISARPAIPETR